LDSEFLCLKSDRKNAVVKKSCRQDFLNSAFFLSDFKDNILGGFLSKQKQKQ